MQWQHWFGIVVLLAVGYSLGRYFPTIGQKVGLP